MLDACGMPGFEMTPTALMSGMEEELLVAFRAQDRGGNDFGLKAQLLHGLLHALTSLLVQRGIANNSSFTHLVPIQLELRLYQNNHFGVGGEQAGQRR